MINNDRIVPVTTIDLLSLYGLIIGQSGTTLTVANANDSEGDFEVTEAPESGSLIASEPVKSLDFATGVSAATVYFVPTLDYVGFSVNGAAVTTTGDTVNPDGRTLYLATLSSGSVSIAKQGF